MYKKLHEFKHVQIEWVWLSDRDKYSVDHISYISALANNFIH